MVNVNVKLATMVIVVAFGTIGTTATAFAQQPDNPECWGTVTSQRATTVGDVGEHSADQEEPRSGIGNLLGHPSELGTFLASVDEIDETQCP
jgi:hypothetical protein